MLITCAGCGAKMSLDAAVNDAAARAAFARIAKLAKPVEERAPAYLALFRSGGRPLAWPKVRRLLDGLADLVAAGKVQVQGGEPRPAPPALWAEAMDAVIEARPTGLKNHNYLRKVAWEKAAGIAAAAETKREKDRQAIRPEEVEANRAAARAAIDGLFAEKGWNKEGQDDGNA